MHNQLGVFIEYMFQNLFSAIIYRIVLRVFLLTHKNKLQLSYEYL